jgi:transposase-like protein
MVSGRQKLKHLSAGQLAAEHNLTTLVDTVNLKPALRGVQPDRYDRHCRSLQKIRGTILWVIGDRPSHYLRFTLSYRDVEKLLAERGLGISYETVRRWVPKFGPAIAHAGCVSVALGRAIVALVEMVVRIAGQRMYLWRAGDDEGEVLDMLVGRRRDTRAALRLIRKLLKKQGFAPKLPVTDKLRSYAAVFRRLRLTCRHEQGLRSRVDDWRGGRRFARLYCSRQLSSIPVSQFAP